MPDAHLYLGVTAIVASPAMRLVMALTERVARTSATVLVTGETGSGKEIVARAIHHYSLRTNRPWVDFSCAALPEHLVESELFGHEKGAFSGAETAKAGLFELAHTGTLFLDEIGELEPRMQVKLLRVLDGVPYYRVGGQKKVAVDARIVAATNQNLEDAVQRRQFRSDLSTASTNAGFACLPCANGATISFPSPNISCASTPGRPPSPARPRPLWNATTGRATCGS